MVRRQVEPDPQSVLPLTPVVLHILLALADTQRPGQQGKHGYAVAQEVESLTGGQIRMGPGTLYGSIQRLLGAGLIEESPRPRAAQADDDERRRYYRLTPLGRRALELELVRLAQVLAVARRKKLLPNPEPA